MPKSQPILDYFNCLLLSSQAHHQTVVGFIYFFIFIEGVGHMLELDEEEMQRYNECVKGSFLLIKDIKKKRDEWDERSQFKLKGVGNLSRSDLDDLDLYACACLDNGGYSFSPYRDPSGDIKKILDAYGIKKGI
jgi:hypothetical protein